MEIGYTFIEKQTEIDNQNLPDTDIVSSRYVYILLYNTR